MQKTGSTSWTNSTITGSSEITEERLLPENRNNDLYHKCWEKQALYQNLENRIYFRNAENRIQTTEIQFMQVQYLLTFSRPMIWTSTGICTLAEMLLTNWAKYLAKLRKCLVWHICFLHVDRFMHQCTDFLQHPVKYCTRSRVLVSESDHRFATEKNIELSHLSESWKRNKDHTKWTKHGSQDSCKPSVSENLATARLIAETWIHELLRGSFDPWQRKFFVTCESHVFLHQVCTCLFLELRKKSTYLAEWEDAKMDKLEFAAPSIATTPLSCLRSCCCWSSLLLGSLLFCTHGNQKGTELQLHISTIME